MMIHRAFLVGCGALFAFACTVVEGDDDSDGGSGGGTSSGGSSAGGASAGGSTSGGATSGGATSGGSGSGGDAAGGEGGDAGPDADAAPDTDASTGDASDGATDPHADGGLCAPDSEDDACSACIKASCCTEWLGCDDDACVGGDASDGELVRFQTCMIAGFASDAGTASADACAAAAAATGGVLAESTQTVVECLVAPTTGGGQRCSVECFGGLADP